jgi:hypothetical protein
MCSAQDGATGPVLVRQVVDQAAKLLADMRQLPTFKDEELPGVVVGLEPRRDGILQLLAAGGGGSMGVLHGMGGIGKTTLAQAVFNALHVRDRTVPCCFLRLDAAVREERSLVEAQLEALKQLVLVDDVQLKTAEQGRRVLAQKLTGRRVLLVVDNVWGGQLQKLLPGNIMEVLGEGSVVLVTSREKGRAEQFARGGRCFEEAVPCMSDEQAMELLIRLGTGANNMSPDILEQLRQVVDRCGGLPMALEVVGKHLCKIRETQQFFSRSEEAFVFVYGEVRASRQGSQRTVFEECGVTWRALSDAEQEAMLHIVTFLQGQPWELVRSYCTDAVLQRLYDLSLVDCGTEEGSPEYQRVVVHNVIVDFCKSVARKQLAPCRELTWEEAGDASLGEELSLVRLLSSACNACTKHVAPVRQPAASLWHAATQLARSL